MFGNCKAGGNGELVEAGKMENFGKTIRNRHNFLYFFPLVGFVIIKFYKLESITNIFHGNRVSKKFSL